MAGNDIRLMEAAIALAEELNFSRAAQKLTYISASLNQKNSRIGRPSWFFIVRSGSPDGRSQ